jgi:hypothetical protein
MQANNMYTKNFFITSFLMPYIENPQGFLTPATPKEEKTLAETTC